MADKNPEPRGIPPTRPFPSQIMHLLELTKLDLDAVAKVVHLSAHTIEKCMIFNAKDTMPTAQWLLLNLYTLAVKDVCWPEALKEYIRARFPKAFPEIIVPPKKITVPDSPPLPPKDAIIDMLYDAGTTLEDVAFAQKHMANTWLGPDNRFMPYGAYELTVMTLWARGRYKPTGEMVDYIQQKYYGMFNPDRCGGA